jgi:Protein of unknown function (DUF3800)
VLRQNVPRTRHIRESERHQQKPEAWLLPRFAAFSLFTMTKTPQVALFCDEAGKETDRFLAVGGLIVTSESAIVVRNHFSAMQRQLNIKSEVKWNKLKKGNRDKFQKLTHLFFDLIRLNHMSFHCIMVDFNRFDHELRPDGGKSASLRRMYYQLILHRLGTKYGKTCHLYAFADHAKELAGLELLKVGLNSVLKSKYKCPENCLKAIEFRDSASETLLQVNDLLLGAVCYQKNRRFEDPEAGHPKANLSGFVLGKSGLIDYDTNTPISEYGFTIWNLESKYLKGS